MEIRAATAGDAPGLSDLLGRHGHRLEPRILGDRLDALRAEPSTALIALEWGPPSGLVVLHWYRALEVAPPIAQVTMLLVDEDARRRGIGRLLVKAGAQAARVAGCDTLELLAPPDQPDLRAFCVATGFTEAGSRFSRALRKKGQPADDAA